MWKQILLLLLRRAPRTARSSWTTAWPYTHLPGRSSGGATLFWSSAVALRCATRATPSSRARYAQLSGATSATLNVLRCPSLLWSAHCAHSRSIRSETSLMGSPAVPPRSTCAPRNSRIGASGRLSRSTRTGRRYASARHRPLLLERSSPSTTWVMLRTVVHPGGGSFSIRARRFFAAVRTAWRNPT